MRSINERNVHARVMIVALFLLTASVVCCTSKKQADVKISGQRIISLSPAATAILLGLSLEDQLVGVDQWSAQDATISSKIPCFAMINPDAERIMALEPTIIFVSSMTRDAAGRDPFEPFSSTGTFVVYIPVSESLNAIRDDVAMIARLTGKSQEGAELLEVMDREILAITTIVQTIPKDERLTVFMEISPAPAIYSFGRGVYLNELLETAGCINIFTNKEGWLAVNAEQIFENNPDVILTNVPSDNPTEEILSRFGWENLSAVRNNRVYSLDNAASSQPAPAVTQTLREIAHAVYPQWFSEDAP